MTWNAGALLHANGRRCPVKCPNDASQFNCHRGVAKFTTADIARYNADTLSSETETEAETETVPMSDILW